MAGHSKWANIKHKKGRADAKRGKVFSRIAKEIITAVKQSGEDPKMNPALRLALQKAKAVNFPNDNIERNIKKASSADQSDFVEVSYEIYGHGGVGIIVEGMTDNKNRSASDVRIACNKCGGSPASIGSVSFNFDRKGIIQISTDNIEEVDLFMEATEAGAENFETAGDIYMIITQPKDLYAVKDQLEAQGITCENSTLEMIPKIQIDCDKATWNSNMKLIDWLEELDDVDAIFHNAREI